MEKQPPGQAALQYPGSGTEDDPFIVEFGEGDAENAMLFPLWRKWLITSIVTLSVFAVTLTSSAYSASAQQITAEFGASDELFALGIAVYVLGFAIGPGLWAPLSELYGRRIWFIITLGLVVAFVAGAAGCKSMAALVVFRLLAGTFGASPLTNSGGVIADMFPLAQRGIAVSVFSAAPFLGPVLGPIMGGFMTITVGWRWIQGVCAIFVGVIWIAGIFLIPETYAPVLLHKRAKKLARETGRTYISILEKDTGGVELSEVFGKALKRPWILLFKEPIVLVAAIYLAILYGTIYMFMGAYPIVYSEMRGWDAGISGLAFLGLAVGMILGLAYVLTFDNARYQKLGPMPPPEARLHSALLGGVVLPLGMFGFAWTNFPGIHWSASIILSAPFGFGCVLVFLACINYLLDAYTIYAASVLAATAMLRAFFGFAFPLFTTQMYHNLGIHWASSIPAFLTVLCLPFPFVMYRHGASLRAKCKYAQEAAILLARLQEQAPAQPKEGEPSSGSESNA